MATGSGGSAGGMIAIITVGGIVLITAPQIVMYLLYGLVILIVLAVLLKVIGV